MDAFENRFSEHWDYLIDWDQRWQRDSSLIFNYISEIFLAKATVPNVLDAAAGTGVDFIYGLKNGFECHASDASASMLEVLKRNLSKRCLSDYKDRIYQIDWGDLGDLNKKFDVILCVGNSFACCIDENERFRAFKGFMSSLSPGGILILDHRNYDHILSHSSCKLKGLSLYYGKEVEIAQDGECPTDFIYSFEDSSSYKLEMRPVYEDRLFEYASGANFNYKACLKRDDSVIVHAFIVN